MKATPLYIFPDRETGKFVSLERVKRALMEDSHTELFISERLAAFSRMPQGKGFNSKYLQTLPLGERLIYALLASAYHAEFRLFVKADNTYYELHDSITRDEHPDVCFRRSVVAGCLRAFEPCASGQVRSGAALYVMASKASKFAQTLIASRARIEAVAKRLLADNRRLPWDEFLAAVRAEIPLAKISDIEAIWNSKLIPAAWHRGGRPKSEHRNRT